MKPEIELLDLLIEQAEAGNVDYGWTYGGEMRIEFGRSSYYPGVFGINFNGVTIWSWSRARRLKRAIMKLYRARKQQEFLNQIEALRATQTQSATS